MIESASSGRSARIVWQTRLQADLFQSQFLYLFILVRAFHGVIGSHLRIGGFHLDCLRRIDADVDDLSCYTQPVELGIVHLVTCKREIPLFIELDRVDGRESVQSVVFKIEHRVLGICDGTRHVELFSCTACQYRQSCSHCSSCQYSSDRMLHCLIDITFLFICFVQR